MFGNKLSTNQLIETEREGGRCKIRIAQVLGPSIVLLSSQKRRWDHVTEKGEKGDRGFVKGKEEGTFGGGMRRRGSMDDTKNIKKELDEQEEQQEEETEKKRYEQRLWIVFLEH